MKSVMQHNFATTPRAEISRSSFDLSHGYKTTFDAGKIIPMAPIEVLPGDTISWKMNAFARMATPLHPVMDNIHLDYFFFYCPTRLVWDNFKKFMGEQVSPGDSIDYTIPTVGTPVDNGDIQNYMGLPIGTIGQYSNLPIRMYWLIFETWFRDSNIQDSVGLVTDDSINTLTNITDYNWQLPATRNKRFDYFTQALPWPQRGDSVDLPLGTKAPVAIDSAAGLTMGIFSTADGNYNPLQTTTGTNPQSLTHISSTQAEATSLYADLSTATSATINELRQAFQIQKLQEKDARGGSRYISLIKQHFNVTNPDYRLQRPEYLGGGTTSINITPIPQTSESGATPQGTLAGFGTASVNSHGFTKSFTEHGFCIPMISARADLTYQQGIQRHWSRQTRYDFYWPSLAHIGEQDIKKKELFADNSATDDEAFGYVPRYDEYRFQPSFVTGLFSSAAPLSLDAWHLSQDFSAHPTLNTAFINEDVPMDRVLAVPAEPDFILDVYNQVKAARPLPVNGIPGLIDHF